MRHAACASARCILVLHVFLTLLESERPHQNNIEMFAFVSSIVSRALAGSNRSHGHREVVKPEVLWFLRNPEEAIEHPLRDLIDEPVPKHLRRISLCLLLYLPLTIVLVYLPATAACMLAPAGMFPLHVVRM